MKYNISIPVLERALELCNASAYLCEKDVKAKYADIMACPDASTSLDSVVYGIKTWDAMYIEGLERRALLEDFNNLHNLLERYKTANHFLLWMLEDVKNVEEHKLNDREIDQAAENLLECVMNLKGE